MSTPTVWTPSAKAPPDSGPVVDAEAASTVVAGAAAVGAGG